MEIAEILAKFGGIYGSIMLVKNFIFVRLLNEMLDKDIKKLEEKKEEDEGLPQHIVDRVSYAGINSLFNRVERDGLHMEDIDSRMEEYDSLLGNHDAKLDKYDAHLDKHDAQLGNIDTEVGRYKAKLGNVDSLLNQLSASHATVLKELKLLKTENSSLRQLVKDQSQKQEELEHMLAAKE